MSRTLDTQGSTSIRVDMTQSEETRSAYVPLCLMSKGNAPYMSPVSLEETSYCVEITTSEGRAWDMGQYVSSNDAYCAAQRVADEWSNVPNARVYVVTRHVTVWNTCCAHIPARRTLA